MITSSFDPNSKPLITPGSFYRKAKVQCEVCIVTFSRKILDHVLRTFECSRIAKLQAVNGDHIVYMFNHQGKDIAVFLSPVGAAGTSGCVLEVSWVIGARKFIMFGSAGSLDNEKTRGHFVVPSQAYRDEGVSYHYAEPSDYTDVRNSKTVAEIFDELEIPHVIGRIWTTDSIFMETEAKTAARRNDGCLAVDMEVSGVQAVCSYNNMDLYCFLETGDVLGESSYDTARLGNANHNLGNFSVALEIASRI